MVPARPSVVIGKREVAEQAWRRARSGGNPAMDPQRLGCSTADDFATCDPGVHTPSVASPADRPSR
jgi:hypothetical protein